MRLSIGAASLGLCALQACSFDFASFHGETTGSGASNAGGAGSASTSSTDFTVQQGSAVSTTASTSSGAGGAADLVPCAGFSDEFATFDTTKWDSLGLVAEHSNHAQLKIDAGSTAAVAWLHETHDFSECYASIAIVNASMPLSVFFSVREDSAIHEGLVYDGESELLTQEASGGMSVSLNALPKRMGIAFHGTLVHFLYETTAAGPWIELGSIPRTPWMDDLSQDDSFAFGIRDGLDGNQAEFDDFNVAPIHLTDLP